MTAEESDHSSVEYWKTRCLALEREMNELKRRNSSLSKQNEEFHRENLKFARIVENLKSGLKLTEDGNDMECKYDLFFTFPEEVWPSILMYVPDSVDLQNLCVASPHLNAIFLDKDKPTWLFDQILPSIIKWLPQKDFIGCRLVCKTWDRAILAYLDGYDSSEDHKFPQSKSHDTPLIWHSKLEPLDFDNVSDLSKFVEEAKVHRNWHGKNLLKSRSLKLGLDMDGDQNNNNRNDVNTFWELAMTLVRTIGRDIWHIEVFNDGFENEPSTFYGLFHQLLCYLPNLKTLRIVSEFEINDGRYFEQDDLVYRLGTWPLPSLPRLKTFHVLHTMPTSMADTIVSSYAGQLRIFIVSVAILIHVGEEHLRGFLNLRELVLRDCVKDVQEFHGLLRRLEWLESPNLKKLRLFRSYSDEEVITTGYLIHLAEKFPRLRVLDTYRMEVAEAHVEEGNGKELRRAYNLRSLKIRNSPKLRFNFLQQMPFLEELCIRDESDPTANQSTTDNMHDADLIETDTNSTIDFVIKGHLYQDKMYESNVWDIMPSLKTVTYESFDDQVIPSGRYTQEMLEFLKKKQSKRDGGWDFLKQ